METTVMVEDTEVTAPIPVDTEITAQIPAGMEILAPIPVGTEISAPTLAVTEISAGQMAGHSIMVAMDWFKLSENFLISSRSLSLDMICFTSRYEIKTFIYSFWWILFIIFKGSDVYRRYLWDHS